MSLTATSEGKAKKCLIEIAPQLHAALKSQAAIEHKPLKTLTEEVVKRGLGMTAAVAPHPVAS